MNNLPRVEFVYSHYPPTCNTKYPLTCGLIPFILKFISEFRQHLPAAGPPIKRKNRKESDYGILGNEVCPIGLFCIT